MINLVYTKLNLFDDLSEIQSSGKTLLEHCSFANITDSKTADLVVDKDIDNIICRFDLEEVFNKEWCKITDNDCLLEQAIYRLIEKSKVTKIEYPSEKEQQKSIGSR